MSLGDSGRGDDGFAVAAGLAGGLGLLLGLLAGAALLLTQHRLNSTEPGDRLAPWLQLGHASWPGGLFGVILVIVAMCAIWGTGLLVALGWDAGVRLVTGPSSPFAGLRTAGRWGTTMVAFVASGALMVRTSEFSPALVVNALLLVALALLLVGLWMGATLLYWARLGVKRLVGAGRRNMAHAGDAERERPTETLRIRDNDTGQEAPWSERSRPGGSERD